jgi:hypothetical protein
MSQGWAPDVEKVGEGERLAGRTFQRQSCRSRYWDIVLHIHYFKGRVHTEKKQFLRIHSIEPSTVLFISGSYKNK